MMQLRELTVGDLPKIVVWRNDPEVNQFLGRGVRTLADAEAWLARLQANPHNILLAIEINGRLAGYCLAEGVDPVLRKAEIGVVVGAKEQWGKGIARAALAELIHICFAKRQLRRLLAVIAGGNERSERLFASLGFVHEGTLREATLINGRFTDLLCYSMLANEYWQRVNE